MIAGVGLGGVFGTDPALGRLEEVRAPLLPRARRRNANEVEPRPHHSPASPDHLDQLLVSARPVRHERAQRIRLPFEVALLRPGLADAQEPLALRLPDRDGEWPVVAPRHDVDRLAHQRGLDDRTSFEGAREIVTPKAFEARPEPDVRVRCVLILDAGEPLQRARDRETHTLEEELAGEQCAVQLALRESALRHRATVPDGRASDTPCAVAMPPTTRSPPSASQMVTGSSRKIAPNVTASGEIPYV